MRWSVMVLVSIVVLAFAAPFLTPFSPAQTDAERVHQPPSASHPLGTDALGRDVFSRVLYGGRRTLIIAALATVASVGPGLLLGLSAAVSGKWGNRIMQVVIDGLLAVPTLMIALILLTLLGRGLAALVLATGASYVALFAQVTRDAALVAQSRPYIEGAHAVGASPVRIVLRHLLPNMLPTVVAFGSVIFSYSILTSAALSFLGLGGDPGQPDWGQVLADGRASLRVAPWVGIVPGALMTLTVMAVNDLADRLALAK